MTSADALKNIPPSSGNANFAKFYFPGGKPLAEGDFVKNPKLANTLELIAKDGVEAFYSGRVGQVIADEVRLN